MTFRRNDIFFRYDTFILLICMFKIKLQDRILARVLVDLL